ncbi:hypothetical protein [Massilibacteroides sp.]|uniref:hypothetical protein n=1 Tax=Massilibacteroides sp. TaxID=2034766 RepID=UPI0026022AE6|nr:hypothetical protein [Massilibacteroides sp.]MDD4514179.1 hypothetical protein [Massilibacteroides sp.]
MIFWITIVCVLFLGFTFRAIEKVHKASNPNGHIIEMGKERDLFYCPGDRKTNDQDDIENP